MLNKNDLISDLRRVTCDVLADEAECYVFCSDASGCRSDKNNAIAVVYAKSVDEIKNVVKIADSYNIPVITRGAGTNVVGACVPDSESIILNLSKMNRIIDINPQNMTAKVQAGVIVGDLQAEADKYGLYFPPDPSNLKVSTIGGGIAQASAGARAFKYGTMKDYVLGLTVVLANGEVINTGSSTIKNAVGYNLSSLFSGSEGTLGIIAEAVLKLIPKPEKKVVMMCYFDRIDNAVDSVNALIKNKIMPCTIDFMDNNSLKTIEDFKHIGILTDKECALILEVDGFSQSVEYQISLISKILKEFNADSINISKNSEEYEKIWEARHSSMAACARLKPNVITDDLVVPRENLSKLVKGVQGICKKYSLAVCLVGHVGDGSVHPQIPVDFSNKDEVERLKSAKSEMYKLCVDLGGVISGEHGVGKLKKDYINYVVDENSINLMKALKKTLDPKNILNPDKIF